MDPAMTKDNWNLNHSCLHHLTQLQVKWTKQIVTGRTRVCITNLFCIWSGYNWLSYRHRYSPFYSDKKHI